MEHQLLFRVLQIAGGRARSFVNPVLLAVEQGRFVNIGAGFETKQDRFTTKGLAFVADWGLEEGNPLPAYTA